MTVVGDPARTLLLLRHAKSSWRDDDLSDADRPLSPRGERAAAVVGQWLRQRRLTPDRVLCSPARRARETLELVCRQLSGPAPPVALDETLYEADAQAIVAAASAVGEATERLLVVGHAPGIPEATRALARRGAGDSLARVDAHFPTAGLARLSAPAPWSALAAGCAHLDAFVVPKDLV